MTVRWYRAALAALLATAALVLGAGTPAGAHGAVDITVHSDGSGSVWATVRWVDGHPVSERLTALVTLTGTAGRIGPAAMRGVPGQVGLVSYGDQLAAGTWRVEVDVATPAIGRCEATVLVGATPSPAPPAETRCPADVPPTVPAAAPADPLDGDGGGGSTGLILGLGALAAAVVGAIVWWRRRPKKHPQRHHPQGRRSR